MLHMSNAVFSNADVDYTYEELKKGMGYPCFQSSLISETVQFFEEMSDTVNCQAYVDPRLDVFAVQTLVKNAHLETVRLWSNFEAMSDRDSKSTATFHLRTEVRFIIISEMLKSQRSMYSVAMQVYVVMVETFSKSKLGTNFLLPIQCI